MQSLGEAPALPNNKSYHLATPSGLKRYSDPCRWCLNPRPQLQNNTTTKQHQTEGKGLGPAKAPEPIRAERRRSDDDSPPPGHHPTPAEKAKKRKKSKKRKKVPPNSYLPPPPPPPPGAAAAAASSSSDTGTPHGRAAAGRPMPPPPSCHSPDRHKQRGDPEETPDPPVTVVLTETRLRASLSTTELC